MLRLKLNLNLFFQILFIVSVFNERISSEEEIFPSLPSFLPTELKSCCPPPKQNYSNILGISFPIISESGQNSFHTFYLKDNNWDIGTQIHYFCSAHSIKNCEVLSDIVRNRYIQWLAEDPINHIDLLRFRKPAAPITIYIVGDSHVRWRWTILEKIHNIIDVDIKTLWIGSKLMNTFGREGLNLINLSISDLNIRKNDIIVFCLGEIDIRHKLHKFITEKNIYYEINRLVSNYVNAINENIKLLPNTITTWIHGMPPIVNLALESNKNFPWPTNGTDLDRHLYTLLINQQIIELSKQYNYEYLDFYTSYVTDDGYLNDEYAYDYNHIGEYTIDTKEQIAKLIIKHINKSFKTEN